MTYNLTTTESSYFLPEMGILWTGSAAGKKRENKSASEVSRAQTGEENRALHSFPTSPVSLRSFSPFVFFALSPTREPVHRLGNGLFQLLISQSEVLCISCIQNMQELIKGFKTLFPQQSFLEYDLVLPGSEYLVILQICSKIWIFFSNVFDKHGEYNHF